MKTIFICSAILFGILFYNTLSAQSLKKETIKVWGNCGMCKKTIEKSAKSAGATLASWDVEKKQLNISYETDKTSSEKIQQAIAKVGYDTQDFTADDKAYHKLHGCCQYERKNTEKEETKQ